MSLAQHRYKLLKTAVLAIGHLRVPPLFQNEVKCTAFEMEIIFHSHASNTHFLKKGCAPSLILKVRGFGTRKWPIVERHSLEQASRRCWVLSWYYSPLGPNQPIPLLV